MLAGILLDLSVGLRLHLEQTVPKLFKRPSCAIFLKESGEVHLQIRLQ